jgi:short-subunit dehydrogenase
MNKIAVITGASKGIGRETANILAKNGYDLAVCARNLNDLNVLKKELESKYKVNIWVKSVDLTIKSEVEKFGEDVLKRFESIDILINNAGIFIPGKITEEEDGTYEKQVALNLSSVYYLCRKIVPNMIKNKNGYIINICSTASFVPYINGGSYCISKFGALGLTKCLREELKEHNIKVTAILPGATKTESWDGTELPDSRFIHPKSVAKVIYNCIESGDDIVHEEVIIRPQLGDIV